MKGVAAREEKTQRGGRGEKPSDAGGWPRVPVGEVLAKVQSGFASGKRDEGGVIQLRMNNVDTQGRFVWDRFLRVPASPEMIDEFRLRRGDVVFNNTNSTELVGKSALFGNHAEPVVYSNHFTRLRVRPDALSPAYLAGWLNHEWQRGTFAEICNRWIGQSAVKPDKLLALSIPLPPLPEQERIAGRLTEQLAAVERARAAAHSRLAAAGALPAAYLREVFEGPGASGWKTVPFGTLANLVNGRAYAQYELLERGTPVIRIQNLNGGDRWYYSNLDLEQAKYCEAGDLLFAWSATFGPYWWRGPKAIFHYHIWRVETGPALDREFAFYLLEWITAAVRNAGQGVAMLHMTKGGMEEWPVSVPPVAEQRRIAQELAQRIASGGGAERLAANLREELAAIEALPAAFLRDAFSQQST